MFASESNNLPKEMCSSWIDCEQLTNDLESVSKRASSEVRQAGATEKEVFVLGLLTVLNHLDRDMVCEEIVSSEPVHHVLEATRLHLLRALHRFRNDGKGFAFAPEHSDLHDPSILDFIPFACKATSMRDDPGLATGDIGAG